MKTTHEVVAQVSQEITETRQAFEAGRIYRNLSIRLERLFNSVPTAPTVTTMALPDDDTAAIAKLDDISATIKESETPKLSDEDLDYLLAHLAATNPKVRDRGAYFIFNDLLHVEAFTEKQMHYIKNTLLSEDFMFYHILEPKNDGIFKRSFSVLTLSALLYVNRTIYHTFSDEEIIAAEDRLATYIVLEKDGRGYVDGKGWAHVYTHLTNNLNEIMSSNLKRGSKLFFLTTVLLGYRRIEDPLVFGEDTRLAMAFSYITGKDSFYADYFLTLLKEWQADILLVRPEESQVFWNRWYNRNRLLQALVLRGDFPENILEYLREIMITY